MRKLAHSGLVVALLGLPLGLATPGCSDDAGGNDKKNAATKGTVDPNAAPSDSEQDYVKASNKSGNQPK